MSAKIAADHLARGAIVYVRRSTMTQVLGNLESQKRRRALADAARAAGFESVTVIPRGLGTTISGGLVPVLQPGRARAPGRRALRRRRRCGLLHRGIAAGAQRQSPGDATGIIWSISVA